MAFSTLLGVEPAAAADGASSCIDANNRGNHLRQQGKLLAAQQEFLSCAVTSCPEIIRNECAHWVTQVKSSIPTVVFAATEASGEDVSAITVFIDGKQLQDFRAGRAIEIDPGARTVRVVAPDGRTLERSIVAREGEKNRTLRFELQPSATAAARRELASPAAGPATAVWVLGGVAMAALGSFAIFGLHGKGREQQLDRCAPHCPEDEIDALYRDYLIADISLGVSVVALGAATYLYFATRSKSAPHRIGVAPVRGGATVGTSIAF